MRLQFNRSGTEQGGFTIPEVFHDCGIYNQFAIESNSGSSANLGNVKLIPFPKRMISENKWISQELLDYCSESAAAEVRIETELIGFRVVPDLHLRRAFEVDPAIGSRDSFVLQHQLIVGVIFVGDEVSALAVVDEFSVLDGPMFFCICHPLIHLGLSCILLHGCKLDRAEVWTSMPAIHGLAIEDRLETSGWISGEGRNGEQGKEAG